MKRTIISTSTLGITGLVTAGLLALPVTGPASADEGAKRDESSSDIVLVADEDDDDLDDDAAPRAQATHTGRDVSARADARDNTRTQATQATRTKNTRTRADNTRDDNSRTGERSGRDKSRDRQVKDWTTDGPGAQKRDWSRNHTNDRSRNNTR